MFKSNESERLRIFPSRGTKPIVDLSIHNRVVPLAHLDSSPDPKYPQRSLIPPAHAAS
jgi:hypothetical protein